MKGKTDCANCSKKDCENCVKEEGKTFCCAHCCNDYKTRKEDEKKETPNVCKFC